MFTRPSTSTESPSTAPAALLVMVPKLCTVVVVAAPVSMLMPEPSVPVMLAPASLSTVIGCLPVMPWRAPVIVPPSKLLTMPPVLLWKSMPFAS